MSTTYWTKHHFTDKALSKVQVSVSAIELPNLDAQSQCQAAGSESDQAIISGLDFVSLHMWQGRRCVGSGYSHWWALQFCGRYLTLSLCSRRWLMLASSKAGELGTGTGSLFGSGFTHCPASANAQVYHSLPTCAKVAHYREYGSPRSMDFLKLRLFWELWMFIYKNLWYWKTVMYF